MSAGKVRGRIAGPLCLTLCCGLLVGCSVAGCSAVGIGSSGAEAGRVRIASKVFTESVILGELLLLRARQMGVGNVEHQDSLGGSRVLFNALRDGRIDVYAEYTGTLQRELLRDSLKSRGAAALHAALGKLQIRMSASLGFDNGYALGMSADKARSLNIRRISDLRHHPGLRFGLSSEFVDRDDGWSGLRRHYGFRLGPVRGLTHQLSYRALASGEVDVIDLYRTDGEIAEHSIAVLHDDQHFFPKYDAVMLWRADLAERAPTMVAAIMSLEGRLSETRMRRANAAAQGRKRSESSLAMRLLRESFGSSVTATTDGWRSRLMRHAREHLSLVAVSLLAAIVCAIPLGIAAARWHRLGQVILAAVGLIQTVPSLVLLVLFIPLLGIGAAPATAALFLYSLLPIVRNTHAGLDGISQTLRESAEALGLPAMARLRLVELPMASPAILAGIKTSAVINVGTATLGALIGAGGFGQPILTGIRLDDLGLILEGALPAALLAVMVQGLFEVIDRLCVPRGLRLSQRR